MQWTDHFLAWGTKSCGFLIPTILLRHHSITLEKLCLHQEPQFLHFKVERLCSRLSEVSLSPETLEIYQVCCVQLHQLRTVQLQEGATHRLQCELYMQWA